MEDLHGNVRFCAFMFKIYMKAACFHVFSPFSASFYPPLHHNGKGSITSAMRQSLWKAWRQGNM